MKRAEEEAKNEEEKRRREQERVQAELERRRNEEILQEIERQRQREERIKKRVKELGCCPVGYRWIKSSGGYRCAGGSHWLDDAQLGV